jgi:hypothetical protein
MMKLTDISKHPKVLSVTRQKEGHGRSRPKCTVTFRPDLFHPSYPGSSPHISIQGARRINDLQKQLNDLLATTPKPITEPWTSYSNTIQEVYNDLDTYALALPEWNLLKTKQVNSILEAIKQTNLDISAKAKELRGHSSFDLDAEPEWKKVVMNNSFHEASKRSIFPVPHETIRPAIRNNIKTLAEAPTPNIQEWKDKEVQRLTDLLNSIQANINTLNQINPSEATSWVSGLQEDAKIFYEHGTSEE